MDADHEPRAEEQRGGAAESEQPADEGERQKIHLCLRSGFEIARTVPQVGARRQRDWEMVAVRIAYGETDLRERAKRFGALRRPQQRLREMRWLDAKRLGIADRVPPG